jgi:hypothetical protein
MIGFDVPIIATTALTVRRSVLPPGSGVADSPPSDGCVRRSHDAGKVPVPKDQPLTSGV